MKTNKLYKLIVPLLFLAGSIGVAWGQEDATTYTINYKNTTEVTKGSPQENISTLEETVYIKNGETRTLEVGNYKFYWYFRWYQKTDEGIKIDNLEPNSIWTGTYLQKIENDDPSYFWRHGIGQSVLNRYKRQYAAQIKYTSDGEEDVVFCDLSFYVDDMGISLENTFTEPTLSKRYQFNIKPASEIINLLSSVTEGESLETFNITVPQGATGINLQMDMTPENYYWGENNQGKVFSYTIDGGEEQYTAYTLEDVTDYNKNEIFISRKVISINGPINAETTVLVYANTGTSTTPGTNSPCLAKFVLTPQEDSGFKTENEIENDQDRNPSKYSERYVEIGSVDFDFDSAEDDGVIDREKLDKDNNMGETAIDPAITTYGFANPTLPWINEPGDMPEDTYGLYRSANVENISDADSHGEDWGKEYNHTEGFSEGTKTYGWYYTEMTNQPSLANRSLYDRTYYNTNEQRCGYFYYVNASQEAGRVVTVPIDGEICSNTELTITAWLADITDNVTVPNVSLILRGENTNTNASAVLHRFSSGNMTRANDADRANWKQLCYKVTISQQMLEDYNDFFVEFHNNAPNSEGADYAIDDIRIYRTLPNIHVNRFEACDANTLTINTEYETILRNMGWTAGEEVESSKDRPKDYKQYGYGLPVTDDGEHYYGNIYFAFLEGLTTNSEGNIQADTDVTEKKDGTDYKWYQHLEEEITPRVLTGGGQYRWVRVNKNLTNPSYQSVYSFRVGVTTNKDDIPDTEEEALKLEKQWNFQAVIDFNNDADKKETGGWAASRTDDNIPDKIDIKRGESGIEIITDGSNGMIANNELTKDNIANEENNDLYVALGEALYSYLQIPRIRCPWIAKDENGEERLYLYEMDVQYTDLMFDGEYYRDADGSLKQAPGNYHVMIFTGEQISGYSKPTDVEDSEIESVCSLISPFTVTGRMVIRIEGDADVNARACLGNSYTISAELLNTEDGSELETPGYSFDWFIGSMEEYNNWSVMYSGQELSLQEALAKFREVNTNYDSQNPDQSLANWNPTGSNIALKEALMELANNNKLKLDAKRFDLILRSEYIVAIPFVRDGDTENTLYCFDPQEAPVPEIESDVPELHPGFPKVEYAIEEEVPLRLGHPNMSEKITIQVPLRNIKMAEGAKYLRAEQGTEISLYSVPQDNPKVGEVVSLEIENKSPEEITDAAITIKFEDDAKELLKEGQSYELLIPFQQYASAEATDPLSTECDGMLSLPVKIVPEYLTWKGEADDNWYDDSKWNQSTEKELHKGDNDTDANGTDNIENAYAPLYFTKVLIPENAQLALESLDAADTEGTLDLTDNTIQYDMAVDTVKNAGTDASTITVKPYYINKIDQVHFEPSAEMLHAELLTYEKAWVDYKLKSGLWHTLASPLQGVVAGDFYTDGAVTGTNNVAGTENQEYFTPITFEKDADTNYNNANNNSRFSPSVYQRGWKGTTNMVTVSDGTQSKNNVAVSGNWSAVYNDVYDEYKPGEGFSLKVLDIPDSQTDAIFRLPKADPSYKYYTKALDDEGNIIRGKSHRLAISDYTPTDGGSGDSESKEVFRIELTKTSNDDYYLVGNPFMANLDAKKFLTDGANSSLADMYWFNDADGVQNIVAIEDGDWITTDSETAPIIPPLHSFFVRKADNASGNVTVTFKDDMQVLGTATSDGTTNTNALILTAKTADGKTSRAAIAYDATAAATYAADEDAELFLDSNLSDVPTIYTVAGTMATSINRTSELYNIPVGIYGNSTEMVTLSFKGLNHFSSATLYDAEKKTETPLHEETTLTVPASTSGRYFLRAGTPTANEFIETSDIQIYTLSGNRVMVTSNVPLKDIRVYTMNGAQVKHTKAGVCSFELYLPDGIYLITAQNTSGETQTEKVVVR